MANSGVAADELPTVETQTQISGYTLLDHNGKEVLFREVYSQAERTLVVFVRISSSCQEYLRHLSTTVTPEVLSGLPGSTSIAIVGCGDPSLIEDYAEALGMVTTWEIGPRPGYISKGVPRLVVDGIWQGLKHIWDRKILKAGAAEQQGGEFLFERSKDGEKRISWCHRMQGSWANELTTATE
ncbi:peroxiredoxin-like family protein [Aspergillus foveolatus]|uniref:peroxiredoxin-like family protein n=1 Tax=Aspergillus foveolatus TaxID=210207 RepID=UPI003CCD2E05